MAKTSFSSDYDQHDSKVFKETLGSFGTTTKPGGNQLQELQVKVRQGVKHVELHLASTGKGQFGVQDVPDKYGSEQRRTIMQLAKLNKQTLSVHGAFDVTSFSGFDQRNGFDDSYRLNAMKEIDETVKFAAETAKSGAVVFHIQGDIPGDKGELNLSKSYLSWLEKQAKTNDKYKAELDNLKKKYFNANPLNREFVSDPDKAKDVREEFDELKKTDRSTYDKYVNETKDGNFKPWEKYYLDKTIQKRKLSPDMQPLVVIGDKISQTQRGQDIINIENLRNKNTFDSQEQSMLNDLGIDLEYFDINTLQRTQSFFSNGFPNELKGKYSASDFDRLKSKILVTYEDVLKENNYLQSQADESFHKKLLGFQIDMAKFQRDDLDQNYIVNEDYLKQIKDIERKEKELVIGIRKAKQVGDLEKVKELRKELNGGLSESEEKEFQKIVDKFQSGKVSPQEQQELERRAQQLQQKAQSSGLQRQKMMIMNEVGQVEYQKLEKYDEMKSQINEQVKTFEEQKKDIKAFADVSFDKNASGIAHLGIKALTYQLDLKKKSKIAQAELYKIDSKISDLEKQYNSANSSAEKDKYSSLLQKEKYARRKWVGMKDYDDIDLINNPLYLAPENMLPGYGSLTSLEEYKAIMRMSQEDFAKKILSSESDYKSLKENYEKETGIKINSHEDALKLAKRHLAGTFDNAHAAVWFKHFKKEDGESDEHRIERFNKWLNGQAEDMAREGLIKHVHFNDTQAKDDDHNLLGQGILDLHDMRERLRKAGIKESFIVEAGGRGAANNLQLSNAFEIFNPNLGYSIPTGTNSSSGVSDWITAERNYQNRPQYSQYGMGYSAFRHNPPQNGNQKGSWSGTGFL